MEDTIILKTQLEESQKRETIAHKVIEDLRRRKEPRVLLFPISDCSISDLDNKSSKELYSICENNGYPIYSYNHFCDEINSNIIGLNDRFIKIVIDY